MSFSNWLTFGPGVKTPGLKILAMPNWIAQSLKSAAVHPGDIQDIINFSLAGQDNAAYEERSRAILSVTEVEYHNNLSAQLDSWLFPTKYESENNNGAKPKDVFEAWHSIPMVCDRELKLRPYTGGSNLIVLAADPEKGYPLTDLYEPLLRSCHSLLSSKYGVGNFNDPLFVDVLNEYMKRV